MATKIYFRRSLSKKFILWMDDNVINTGMVMNPFETVDGITNKKFRRIMRALYGKTIQFRHLI